MSTAMIAGASGLTGSTLLGLLLESNAYERVKVLVRRPLEIEHPSLEQIVYDYEHPDNSRIQADHVYCCLGTTMKKAGSRDAFFRIDHDYPLQIARAAYQNGAAKFALVSAVGANPGSMFFYNRV
ncbi:MAG: NAD(P)H-binding protein, partial [Bacteroidales bacterium]|nr:NAD(P)H-binding protein [Bacteroidales bacterium]